jgi:hypothetical protein
MNEFVNLSMSDVLILQERIRNSILVGESDFREFKSALEGKSGSKKPRLSAKTLVKRLWRLQIQTVGNCLLVW